MDQAKPMSAATSIRILHGALAVGLVLVGGTFAFLLSRQGPIGGAPNVGIILAAVAMSVLALAGTILRRRVPERRGDQSPDTYWASRETTGPAVLLWGAVDLAGLTGWVGYLMTGALPAAAAAAVCIAALFLVRPASLERAG